MALESPGLVASHFESKHMNMPSTIVFSRFSQGSKQFCFVGTIRQWNPTLHAKFSLHTLVHTTLTAQHLSLLFFLSCWWLGKLHNSTCPHLSASQFALLSKWVTKTSLKTFFSKLYAKKSKVSGGWINLSQGRCCLKCHKWPLLKPFSFQQATVNKDEVICFYMLTGCSQLACDFKQSSFFLSDSKALLHNCKLHSCIAILLFIGIGAVMSGMMRVERSFLNVSQWGKRAQNRATWKPSPAHQVGIFGEAEVSRKNFNRVIPVRWQVSQPPVALRGQSQS